VAASGAEFRPPPASDGAVCLRGRDRGLHARVPCRDPYPQVGGSKLHIAHVLWGGLLLLAALLTTLSFLSPAAKPLAATAGGVGFGLFIDEVGKFVTKDVNYFYRPAIAIIYEQIHLQLAATRSAPPELDHNGQPIRVEVALGQLWR
jgi:hypothetical protein